MACALPPPGGGGKRGRDTKVSLPLLTPQPFPRTRLPPVARLKARGPQGRLVLQGYTLDRSGAFRSGTLPPCTGWPRTVMRGGSRKMTSGPDSVPKSARRTEPSPRNPRLAANASLSGLKEGLGCQEGKGNHRCPVPSCLRRQTAALPRRGYGVLLPVSSNYPFGQNKSTDSKSMLLLLERLTRLELATSTLARWRSTR